VNYYQTILDVINYIEKNLKEDTGIYEIAEYVNFSVPYIYRLFKVVTGETIKSYILKRRLSYAAYDIKTSKRRISDIAYEYGFESHDVFTRAFIRVYKVYPSRYRNEGIDLGLYELSINKNIDDFERSGFMNYKVINKDKIIVIGMEDQAKQWDSNGAIGRLWSGFFEGFPVT
jgi:AraC family transcriptional regulator